jgi:tetratricopeptide (TPR) repeat protein
LDSFLQAVRKFEKCSSTKTTFYRANCYQNIGNIYNATENFKKALTNYDQAIGLYEKVPGQEISLAMNIASKGMVYNKMGKNQEALEIYKLAEKKLIALNETVSLAYVKSWMGTTYLDLHQYDKSIESSQSAFETINKIGDQNLIASTIQIIGHAHLLKGIEANLL